MLCKIDSLSFYASDIVSSIKEAIKNKNLLFFLSNFSFGCGEGFYSFHFLKERKKSLLTKILELSKEILIVLGCEEDGRERLLVLSGGKVVFDDELSSSLFLKLNLGKERVKIALVSKDKLEDFSLEKEVCKADLALVLGKIETLDGEAESFRDLLFSYSKGYVMPFYFCQDERVELCDARCYLGEVFSIDYYFYSQSLEEEGFSCFDLESLRYQKKLFLPSSLKELKGTNSYIECEFLSYKEPTGDVVGSKNPLLVLEQDLFNEFIVSASQLAHKLEMMNCKDVVLGLSGGVDSTAALFSCLEAFKILGLDKKNIHSYSLRCFGSSKRTRDNARDLAKELGVSFGEIGISKLVLQHFKDIAHDKEKTDVVFENAQARARTLTLLDLANKYNALMIGTADLSESVLGWCTYGGDQLSMYNVNLSFSKSQLQAILEEYAKDYKVVKDILETEISPELLPLKDGKSGQSTENIVGSYKLIDFFIYCYFYLGFSVDKCISSALDYFKEEYKEKEIRKYLEGAERRYYRSSFKRITAAKGPIVSKIASVVFRFDECSSYRLLEE